VKYDLCRTIYWAEAGVIKSSLDDGWDITILADGLGNITAIDVAHGNFAFSLYIYIYIHLYSPLSGSKHAYIHKLNIIIN